MCGSRVRDTVNDSYMAMIAERPALILKSIVQGRRIQQRMSKLKVAVEFLHAVTREA